MSEIIIHNGTIVTMNPSAQVINDGAIVISDDKIVAIGKTEEITNQYKAEKYINAKLKIVMPGLINTHTHMAMTVFRGMADDVALQDWLMKYIFPAEAKYVTADMVNKGSKLAVLEMISTGTTTFNDMYYYEEEVANAAHFFGMRGIIAEGLVDFPVPNSANPDEGKEYTEYLINKYKNDSLISACVSAHAPYTCSPALMKSARVLADKYNVNYHIHLAETQWEVNTIKKKYSSSPVKFLDELGVLKNKTVAAHSIWLKEDEMEIYKERNVSVAHNPECNMKISSGAARIPQMLSRGINVGLGTDGTASNNNLNLFEEMQTAAFLHKFVNQDPTVLNAYELIKLVTIGGAKAIGLDDITGSLELGKKADIILVDINTPNATPMYDPYSTLAYSINGKDVTDVIINGKHVMENNSFPGIDTEKVLNDVNELAKNIKENL